MISFKTQNLSVSDILNELICQIDVKIAKTAENKLNASRYGAKVCVNLDTYSILNKYRQILKDKGNNSACLFEYKLEDIISNIKQYLSSGKVVRFKKSELEKTTTTPKIKVGDLQKAYGEVNYNFYGNQNIFESNTYKTEVTQTGSEEWDSDQW